MICYTIICSNATFWLELDEIDIRQCQRRGKPGEKKIDGKFQPQPELGHQVPQELEDGDGGHGAGREGRTEGDFESIFFGESCSDIYLNISKRW